MRRREFIAGLGGTVLGPFAARAQQDGRVRRIGILDVSDEADRFVQTRWGATREVLAKLGWVEGRNVRFDLRFSASDPERRRRHADELVRLAPTLFVLPVGRRRRRCCSGPRPFRLSSPVSATPWQLAF